MLQMQRQRKLEGDSIFCNIIIFIITIAGLIILTSLSETSGKESDFVENKQQIWMSYFNRAWKEFDRGNFSKSEEHLKRSLTEAEKIDRRSSDVATILNVLAKVYEKQGKFVEAEQALERALFVDQISNSPNDPNLLRDLNNLAHIYYMREKYDRGEESVRRIISILEQEAGNRHADMATALNDLAVFLELQGRYEEAEGNYLQALRIFEEAFGSTSPLLLSTLENYIALLKILGRDTEADHFESQVQNIKSDIVQ